MIDVIAVFVEINLFVANFSIFTPLKTTENQAFSGVGAFRGNNTTLKVSVFGVIVVRIFPHSN